MRLIDAEALINTLQDLFDKREKEARFTGGRGVTVTWNDAIYHIKIAPTIEPARKCGKWLPDNTNYITPHFVCSACGMSQKVETAMYKPIWAFCPRCGARMMKGEQE